MNIRTIKLNDAENFMHLIKQVESESEFMLYEPGERNVSLEGQKNMIENFLKRENSTIFVAEEEKQLVGYLIVNGGSTKRTQHSAYLVIGLRKLHRGKGIGTSLFKELEKWARYKSIHRLELTVVSLNEAGIALYKNMGFKIEGIKRDSLFINNSYVDEYYMSKIL